MIQSSLVTGGPVTFPEHLNERVYMREIKRGPLPADLARWQPTVDAMLDGIEFDGPAYLMIDQGEVEAGTTHRRGGWHVDGYWDPGLSCHQQGHTAARWKPAPTHRPVGGHSSMSMSWADATFEEPELLLLASDVVGCRVALGQFKVDMKDGGDCDGVDVSHMDVRPLAAGVVHKGTVALLHESIPLEVTTKRTLVRINIPGVTLH